MDDLPLSYRGIDFVSMTMNCRVYIVHFNSRKLGKVEPLTCSIFCAIEDESRPLVYEIDSIPLTRIKPWVSWVERHYIYHLNIRKHYKSVFLTLVYLPPLRIEFKTFSFQDGRSTAELQRHAFLAYNKDHQIYFIHWSMIINHSAIEALLSWV